MRPICALAGVFLPLGAALSSAMAPPALAQSEFDRAREKLLDYSARPLPNLPSQTDAIAWTMLEAERQAKDLVVVGVLRELNRPSPPTPEKLQADLQRSMGNAGVLEIGPAPGEQLLVYFSAGACPVCSRSWIGVFSNESGKYALAASLDNSEPNETISAILLPPTAYGQPQILIRSEFWGDPHHRQHLHAYRLQNGGLDLFWARFNMPYGTVSVKADQIKVEYRRGLKPTDPLRSETFLLSGLLIAPQVESASNPGYSSAIHTADDPCATLYLTPEDSTVPLGTQIQLNVQLTNVCEQELNASVSVSDIGPGTAYTWDIRNERGESVTLIPPPRPWVGEAWFRTLKPAETINDGARISRMYAMKEAGKYTIRAFWKVPDFPNQTVASNEVHVTVVK